MPHERMAFPVWMSAVNTALLDIADRLRAVGFPVPLVEALGPTAYAMYADIDPAVTAVIIMREAIEVQRHMRGRIG